MGDAAMTGLNATPARSIRLYQCPGCWGYGLHKVPPTDGSLECECGERLDCIDLRGEHEGDTATWDDVTSGPVDYPREGAVPTAVQNAWNAAHEDDYLDDEDARCEACDELLTDNDHSTTVCDDCSGLSRCCDDMCHGQGYCMHKKDAWRA